MLFHPQSLTEKNGSFVFSSNVSAVAHPCLCKEILREFWQGFTYRCSSLSTTPCEEFVFSVGNVEKLPLNGYDYSIRITPEGICLYAETEQNLLKGFMTLLDRFQAIDAENGCAIEAECCEILDRPLMQTRMVHFCILPETELWELERFIRFAAALKFSHVVLEFWGMLKYDCMKELAWSHAYSKEQLRPILAMANDLGLEVVPMFNHWGHATAGRVMHGKHVVLDQNPTLQTYFSEDGWCWNIQKPKVRALLQRIREELCELCGSGSYFHIGCDEAYNFSMTQDGMDMICNFINEVHAEMAEKGRRVIAWGDMFLYQYPHYNPKNAYVCHAPTPEAEAYLLSRIHRDVVLADWQYDATEAPVETALVFQRAGFNTLLCPWDCSDAKLKSCVNTVKEHALSGLLHTTWHTLSGKAFYVTIAALGGWQSIEEYKPRNARTHTAALMRKVYFVNGDYQKAGWGKFEIDTLW